MSKSIEAVFTGTGEVKIEAQGFKGQGCEEATRFLEEALGQTTARKKKPEYQQQNTGANRQRT